MCYYVATPPTDPREVTTRSEKKVLGTVQKTMATTTRSMTNNKEISLKLKNDQR